MKLIVNKKVALHGRARNIGVIAKAASIDTDGAHTTVAHFLCGENPWGFHNDMRFSLPLGAVKLGERIIAAAEATVDANVGGIVLSNDDYEVLLSAVVEPRRHVAEMAMPPVLARAILPIIEAIVGATETSLHNQ
ncbi:MAG: hypothetical protein ACTS8S_06755 [Giesbergeria sp.]|jgi:hypothetical protein